MRLGHHAGCTPLSAIVRKILLSGAAAILLPVIVVVGVGYLLPVKHVAVVEREMSATPTFVFAAISATEEYPRWRTGVERVEPLPDEAGLKRFREVGSDDAITYVVQEAVPDRRLVTRIADPSLPFGGAWSYDLRPTQTGTIVRITENGEVYNPVFRFVSRFVMGHERTMKTYLSDLDRFLSDSGSISP